MNLFYTNTKISIECINSIDNFAMQHDLKTTKVHVYAYICE